MLFKQILYCIAEQLSVHFPDRSFEIGSGKSIFNILGHAENVVYRWSICKKGLTSIMLITSISNLDVYCSSMTAVAEHITSTAVQNGCDCVALSSNLTLPSDIATQLKRYGIKRVDFS